MLEDRSSPAMSKKGAWKRLFSELGENPDLECLIIDSTVCAGTPVCSGANEDEAIGRSRDDQSTKISFAVDPSVTLSASP
jgi:hypothetical protein